MIAILEHTVAVAVNSKLSRVDWLKCKVVEITAEFCLQATASKVLHRQIAEGW